MIFRWPWGRVSYAVAAGQLMMVSARSVVAGRARDGVKRLLLGITCLDQMTRAETDSKNNNHKADPSCHRFPRNITH
jgi:hypothetical protein